MRRTAPRFIFATFAFLLLFLPACAEERIFQAAAPAPAPGATIAEPVTAVPNAVPAVVVSPPTEQAPDFTATPPGTPLPPLTPNAPFPEVTYAPLDPDLPAPPTAVPTAASLFDVPEYVTLYALLGNDVDSRHGGRTDSMILAAVNARTETVTLLSIPRDLYVVIPGWTMQRLNLAYAHGGTALFKETVAYNLGLPVDHTLRLGFDGFKAIVDAVEGLEVVVNCPVEDWRLKAPELDPNLQSSWQLYELGYGIQEMDGEMALWYARSRRSSGDIERGRRQQKILRALAKKIQSSPAPLERLPALVNALWTAVETDLSLEDALLLARQAPRLAAYTVQHALLPADSLQPWTVPEGGEAVQLFDWQAARPVLQALAGEPALHGARRSPIRVVIQSDDFVLYRQAAENLAWYGFEPVYEAAPAGAIGETSITFRGPSLKGAFAERLAWILRQDPAAVLLQPSGVNGEAPAYHVQLAPSYNPCLNYSAGPAE